MKTKGSKEFRRANLLRLLDKFSGQREFASLTNLAANNLSDLVNGKRNMGDAVARRIERMLNLPCGWIDTPRDDDISSDDVPQIVPAQLSATLEDLMLLPETDRAPLVNYIHELAGKYRNGNRGLESGAVDRPLGTLGSDGYDDGYDENKQN